MWTSLSLSLSSPPWSYVFYLVCSNSLMWILIWIINLVQLLTLDTVWYCPCYLFVVGVSHPLLWVISVCEAELTYCDVNLILFDIWCGLGFLIFDVSFGYLLPFGLAVGFNPSPHRNLFLHKCSRFFFFESCKIYLKNLITEAWKYWNKERNGSNKSHFSDTILS